MAEGSAWSGFCLWFKPAFTGDQPHSSFKALNQHLQLPKINESTLPRQSNLRCIISTLKVKTSLIIFCSLLVFNYLSSSVFSSSVPCEVKLPNSAWIWSFVVEKWILWVLPLMFLLIIVCILERRKVNKRVSMRKGKIRPHNFQCDWDVSVYSKSCLITIKWIWKIVFMLFVSEIDSFS